MGRVPLPAPLLQLWLNLNLHCSYGDEANLSLGPPGGRVKWAGSGRESPDAWCG
jgi:hypothetical protein